MELLRLATAGHVDDGKSTLIGRLMFDSQLILDDQYEALRAASKRRGLNQVDLALLTDGLRAEREQGITIDVAYRYFSTGRRKFILVDCPGHVQYTRNMITGASNANLIIILIDARNGISEQTKRHAFIASLLQIPNAVVCVNKMDLVGYDQNTFNHIVEAFNAFVSKLDIRNLHYVPISALLGDNVVDRSRNMDWYGGSTLMHILENVHIGSDNNHIDARFPVQYVVRPMKTEYHDYRGYAGRVAGGIFRTGEKVAVLPSGLTSKIKGIEIMGEEVKEAFAPMSVIMTLEDDIDISRGDMIVKPNNLPQVKQEVDVMVCWMSDRPLQVGGKYAIKHTSRDARCVIKEVRYKMNINSLQKVDGETTIGLNDIGRIKLRTTASLFFDGYRKNRITGSVIIIDEGTNNTVGAGMIV